MTISTTPSSKTSSSIQLLMSTSLQESISFTQRALNKPEDTYDLYFEIEVLKELPFTSLDATVIPWFDQEGNGKQAMWYIPNADNGYPMTWNDLVDLDYIIIRVKKSPNHKYSQFANTVLK